MSGYKTGVQTQLPEKQPGMIYMQYTAHRCRSMLQYSNQSMLDSMQFNHYLTTFNENINNTFKFKSFVI